VSLAESTLADLVAIDSASTRSNRPVIDYLQARLQRLGFRLHPRGYRDAAGAEKINLVACAGPHSEPPGRGGLALVGHTDTVPFDPAWTEALVLQEREGRLFGRGACDTKGFIAAILAALEAVDLQALTRPLVAVFTADEELGCLGAKRLLEERALQPALAIVGEPTGLRPVRAHKGFCHAEFEVRGHEGHSAYPHTGRSAIFDAARTLLAIEEVAAEITEEVHPDFEPPWTTLNVGLVEGGKALNVIPGSCRFSLEWRPIPGQPPERLTELLDRQIARLKGEDPGFEASYRVVRRDPGVEVRPDAPLVRFLEQESGQPSGTVSFGTELPYFVALGAEGCVFGPGDIRVAHKTGEYVPRDQLEQAVRILARAITRFCC
jgi:acetylornithine deacetylase